MVCYTLDNVFRIFDMFQIDLKKVKFYMLRSLVSTGKKEYDLSDAFCSNVEPEICAAIERVRFILSYLNN